MAWGNITDLYRANVNTGYDIPVKADRVADSVPAVALEKEQQTQQIEAVKEPEQVAVRKANAGLEDIALSFNRSTDYGYIGKDSSIVSLDMQQAISAMQKDQLLQQYQTFVGRSGNLIAAGNDGLVVAKA